MTRAVEITHRGLRLPYTVTFVRLCLTSRNVTHFESSRQLPGCPPASVLLAAKIPLRFASHVLQMVKTCIVAPHVSEHRGLGLHVDFSYEHTLVSNPS